MAIYDTISHWARRTSAFAELLGLGGGTDTADAAVAEAGGLIYRLKHWPQLPARQKNADVYRTLSVMSHRPVNRHWILATSRLTEKQVDRLLARLVDEGAVEVIDSGKFTR